MFDFAQKIIDEEMHLRPRNWLLAYSGGKDSSLVLKLFWNALLRRGGANSCTVVYCDTGSENPLAAKLALDTLEAVRVEAQQSSVPLRVEIVKPSIERRLLVRIIGRGYPPPNTFFRWCTKDLRIRPVQAFLLENSAKYGALVLGVRRGESVQRDRSFALSAGNYWSTQKEGTAKIDVFMPIVDLSVEDVWDGLHWVDRPRAVDAKELWALYEQASGECPILRQPNDPPCGKGRFGCWLCTVVRRDRTAEKLIEAGRTELLPLMEFRRWLLSIRNDPTYRCAVRRSGVRGLGPFRLRARQVILEKLRESELSSGLQLLTSDEVAAIKWEWNRDTTSPTYRED